MQGSFDNSIDTSGAVSVSLNVNPEKGLSELGCIEGPTNAKEGNCVSSNFSTMFTNTDRNLQVYTSEIVDDKPPSSISIPQQEIHENTCAAVNSGFDLNSFSADADAVALLSTSKENANEGKYDSFLESLFRKKSPNWREVDHEVLADTAISNQLVENGAWFYNVIRSILEGEQKSKAAKGKESDKVSFERYIKVSEYFDLLSLQFKTLATIENLPNQPTESNIPTPPPIEEVSSVKMEYNQFLNLYEFDFKQIKCAAITECSQTLFSLFVNGYSIAHCVSEDLWVSNQISMHFRDRFDLVEHIYAQKQTCGGLSVLNIDGKYIYYLVTKKLLNSPTDFKDLFSCINKMYDHVRQHSIGNLAIGKTTIGFDDFEWPTIQQIFNYFFGRIAVDIKVCELPSSSGWFPSIHLIRNNIINISRPLVYIEQGTVVIYFGLKNGFMTNEIRTLHIRFGINIDYRSAARNLGDIITGYKEEGRYLLCGFIVKETEDDEFDFVFFKKCVNTLAMLYIEQGLKYKNIALEAFVNNDPLIMNKIANILRFSFKTEVDICICWPDNSQNYMFLPTNKYGQCI